MIARVHPLAKLLGSMILALTLLSSIDWVSATVALTAVILVLGFSGIPPLKLLLRTSPLLIAAPLSGVTTLLYGVASGTTYWQWGLIHISDGSIELALATALRVLAIGLPAVVLFITIDPTDLADGLAQILRLPSRFVIGALAALAMWVVFADSCLRHSRCSLYHSAAHRSSRSRWMRVASGPGPTARGRGNPASSREIGSSSREP